ncbi:MAG: hypothetical protein FJ146_05245 [Deltaproteobacteria bacterium]|nr:hypothetical protein [Deltaproteobacteria bacterium]
MRRVLTISLVTCLLSIASSGFAADKAAVKKSKASKAKKATSDFAPLVDAPSSDLPSSSMKLHSFGAGVGLFSVFLPQTAAQVAYIYKGKLMAGLQLGYLTIPLTEFSAQSIYIGVDGKFYPVQGASFFVGGAVGKRDLTIKTRSTVTINDDVTEIFWTRKASQTLITPRVGWQALGKGNFGTAISLGLTLPLGTAFSVASDPTAVPGLTEQEYADEKVRKGNDVLTFTSKPMPHMELSFFWYFPN